MCSGLISLAVVLAPHSVWAGRKYEAHSGYLKSIDGERNLRVQDMVVILPPEPTAPPLKDRIFNEKLTREFNERYDQTFGRSETQRAYLDPNPTSTQVNEFGFPENAVQYEARKRKFGEFMLRRLTEFHIENYAKNEPRARPVWEVKERVSQVRLSVGPKVRVNAKYSISGNSADINVANPWLNSKVSLRFGGGSVEETFISLSRQLTSRVLAESHYAINDGIVTFVGRRQLAPQLSTSLTASTYTNRTGTSTRESLYLAGFAYTY